MAASYPSRERRATWPGLIGDGQTAADQHRRAPETAARHGVPFDRRLRRRRSARPISTVGLAPNYLAGLFSAQLARSPHQYQTELRLDRAKQLLTNSDLSVTAIAAAAFCAPPPES